MPKDRREHLLLQARDAGELPGASRRRAVAGLIHERFRAEELEAAFRGDAPDIPCTVEEIILSAYPTTDYYWRAWLNGRLPRDELIDRLAEASAISEIDLQRRCRLLREVLAACPLDIENSAATVGARWLADHPDAEGLLPSSLLTYLSGTQRRYEACTVERTASPPAGEQEAMPAAAAADAAQPESTPRTEEESETAFVRQLAGERASTGYCASRVEHFAWGAAQTPRIPQATIVKWRRRHLTADERKPGARPHNLR
jgi:hypothetical protein